MVVLHSLVATALLFAVIAFFVKRGSVTRGATVFLALVIVLREISIGAFHRTQIKDLMEKQILTEEFAGGMGHMIDYCYDTSYMVYLLLLFMIILTIRASRNDLK